MGPEPPTLKFSEHDQLDLFIQYVCGKQAHLFALFTDHLE